MYTSVYLQYSILMCSTAVAGKADAQDLAQQAVGNNFVSRNDSGIAVRSVLLPAGSHHNICPADGINYPRTCTAAAGTFYLYIF